MQERLQKLIAQAGVASRRAAEKLITEGAVTVNGQIVTELGTKADPEKDHIKVNGKLINLKIAAREKVYILLNKPKGYLSSAADPEGRKLVVDLVAKSFGKVHPVGRLDYNTEGLLILTNDGDFTNLVASSKKIPKVYEVKVKGLPPKVALNKLRRGTMLDDGFKTAPAEITELRATENNGWFEVTLHEGHNQQIRKMFDSIGHSVVKLKRVSIGGLADETLPVGAYRALSQRDIDSVTKPPKKKVEKAAPKQSAKSSAPRDDRRRGEGFSKDRTEKRETRPERPRKPTGDAPRRKNSEQRAFESPRGGKPRLRFDDKTGQDFRMGQKLARRLDELDRKEKRNDERPRFSRSGPDRDERSRTRDGERSAFKRDDFGEKPRRAAGGARPENRLDDFGRDDRPRSRASRSGPSGRSARPDRSPVAERTARRFEGAKNHAENRDDRPPRRASRPAVSGGVRPPRPEGRSKNSGGPRPPKKR